jgi:hypothetical protein
MISQEEECPVADSLLGTLYRSGPEGLPVLVESIPSSIRAILAVYCFRREHLRSLGLAIASTCDVDDLVKFAGKLGAAIFAQAHEVQERSPISRITLCREPLRHFVEQDLV